ncbi:hypothetical protein EYF80_056049 [Liparis tanakae]|uniref:Uncharacterized protein n=1 Tax=Liparis tanakae TaxID=230148 RepID=A0A4Z2EY58_9TELE|nr:hypothetical protein EYF80_056049 [Liparis tanakae]
MECAALQERPGGGRKPEAGAKEENISDLLSESGKNRNNGRAEVVVGECGAFVNKQREGNGPSLSAVQLQSPRTSFEYLNAHECSLSEVARIPVSCVYFPMPPRRRRARDGKDGAILGPTTDDVARLPRGSRGPGRSTAAAWPSALTDRVYMHSNNWLSRTETE